DLGRQGRPRREGPARRLHLPAAGRRTEEDRHHRRREVRGNIKTLIITIVLAAAPAARAAFEAAPSGARPAALGNAYTARAEGGDAVFFNPAGLANVERPEASLQYGRLDTGLDDGSRLAQTVASGATPLRNTK